MRILVINPNTTASMTEKIAKAARKVARPDTEIVPANPAQGPSSIQGFLDAAICVPEVMREIKEHKDLDGIVIACFDDTGLDAIRSLVGIPVVGIGEAAFHAASMLGTKFSVITTLSRSVAGLEANLLRYGLATKCGKVRATDIPVLKLEEGAPREMNMIRDAISAAIDHDGADTIVLGCAGMTDLAETLSQEFSVPVIDGVVCAVTFVEALVAAGLQTSKSGGYAYPLG